MKSLRVFGGCVIALACAIVLPQTVAVRGSGGWGAAAPFNMLYNQGSVVTFDGKVIGIERSAPMPGMEISVAALVKSSNGGTSTVDFGPAWYVDNLQTSVKMGDRVRVTGSKVFREGRSMILAQQVVRNNNVMYLRSEDGFPMWVAWRGHVTVGSNSGSFTTADSNTYFDTNTGVIDANGITVIDGTVADIIEVPVGREGTPSVILIVGNGYNAFSSVYLGPTWFVNRQDMFFNVGDRVTIRGEVNGVARQRDPRIFANSESRVVTGRNSGNAGSRVGGEVNGDARLRDPRIWVPADRRGGEVNGQARLRDPRIWATQVRRGNQILQLRGASGFPVWTGGRRR